VLDRTNGKFISAKQVRDADDLGQRLQRQDRPPQLYRRQPPRRAGHGRRQRGQGQDRVRQPLVPGRQELDADGLFRPDRPVLHPVQRLGHGHLEHADRLQEGRGLSGRQLHDQADCRGSHRRIARHGPKTGKIVWEYKNKARCGAA
jgi:hypothetical protein